MLISRRTEWLFALVTLVAVGGLCACADSDRAPMASPASTTPATTTSASLSATITSPPELPSLSVGRDVNVADAWFQNADVGWALGQRGCFDKPCSTVLRTTDGGASWQGVAELPVAATGARDDRCAPSPFVKGIRFADALNGFAYGESFLVTTDGGATWQAQSAPAIDALEVDGPDVLRVVRDVPRCESGCNYSIEYAEGPAQPRTWKPASLPSVVGYAAELLRHGDDAYLLVGHNPAHGATGISTRVLVSHDRGRDWTERADPCGEAGPGSDAHDAAVGTDGVLVVLCVGMSRGEQSLRLSSDGAETFGAPALIPAEFRLFGQSHVAAATADNVLIASNADATAETVVQGALGPSSDAVLLRTTDRGRRFEVVVRAVQHDYFIDGSLAFTSPTTAIWVSSNASEVFRSSDAGSTWTSGTFR